MDQLDGDDGRLRNSAGVPAARDIVQFVKFNECRQRGNLAEEVLKEVPEQVCSYMERTGFKPVAQVNLMNEMVQQQATPLALETPQAPLHQPQAEPYSIAKYVLDGNNRTWVAENPHSAYQNIF